MNWEVQLLDIKNRASGKYSSAFWTWKYSQWNEKFCFGGEYQVTGERSGAFGVGTATFHTATNQYEYYCINEGNNSYMIGNYNKIASGSDNNFILGNNISIGAGVQNSVVFRRWFCFGWFLTLFLLVLLLIKENCKCC